MIDPATARTGFDPAASADADPARADLDPGLTGQADRPVPSVDNGYVAGYRVRFDEAGPDGQLRTSALLRYAQDVAWRHSEALGFDRRWYLDRGRWWVVRAVDLEVIEPIGMGRTLRVSTAVVGHRRIWARRLGDARLSDGRLAARTVTDWVMLDDAGRLVRIPQDFGLSFTNPEIAGEILRVPMPVGGGHGSEIRFAVRPHDLDPMGHVNNAVYLDWVEEGLLAAGAASARSVPRRARLEYVASAAPDDDIVVTTWCDGPRWASRVSRGDGSELLRAVGAAGIGAVGGGPVESDAGSRSDGARVAALGDIEGVPAIS